MKTIKIGYFADGPWAHKTFQKIIKDNSIEIKFIVPRTFSNDYTLLQYAEKHKIPYHKGVRINSDEFYNMAISYNCDLFVSMSFNQIFKNKIINLPRYNTINCHAGKLPFYRGRNVLNWVLINDEKEFGITVHFVDEGIDTGDIILQRIFSINDFDDYKSLLDLAYEECANILYEAIKLIQEEKMQRVKQTLIHPVGFYCGRRIEGDEIIDWNKNSREVFNLIRAICDPGPMATTFFKDTTVKINKSQIIDNAPQYTNIAGQIIGKTKEGFIVKTKDTSIEIQEIKTDIQLKVGDRLG